MKEPLEVGAGTLDCGIAISGLFGGNADCALHMVGDELTEFSATDGKFRFPAAKQCETGGLAALARVIFDLCKLLSPPIFMPGLPQPTLNALLQEDWDALLKRLILFTDRRLQRYRWRGVFGGVVPNGQDPSGIAVDAVADLLAGRYVWQREGDFYTSEELWNELTRLVCNQIKALWSLKENMTTNSLDESDRVGKTEGADHYQSTELSPDQHAQRREATAALIEIRNQLVSFLEGEPLLIGLIECTFRGILRREEIASALKTSPADVTNARKRLERRLEHYVQLHPGCPLTLISELIHA